MNFFHFFSRYSTDNLPVELTDFERDVSPKLIFPLLYCLFQLNKLVVVFEEKQIGKVEGEKMDIDA